LAGVSWSEFAAGTLRAQLGYLGIESGGLNFAETRVRSVPGKMTSPVSRLYVHVTVFRPVREAEVIFMQQVTEIYGEEGGWDSLAWHGFTTMSSHTRQEIWCA